MVMVTKVTGSAGWECREPEAESPRVPQSEQSEKATNTMPLSGKVMVWEQCGNMRAVLNLG